MIWKVSISRIVYECTDSDISSGLSRILNGSKFTLTSSSGEILTCNYLTNLQDFEPHNPVFVKESKIDIQVYDSIDAIAYGTIDISSSNEAPLYTADILICNIIFSIDSVQESSEFDSVTHDDKILNQADESENCIAHLDQLNENISDLKYITHGSEMHNIYQIPQDQEVEDIELCNQNASLPNIEIESSKSEKLISNIEPPKVFDSQKLDRNEYMTNNEIESNINNGELLEQSVETKINIDSHVHNNLICDPSVSISNANNKTDNKNVEDIDSSQLTSEELYSVSKQSQLSIINGIDKQDNNTTISTPEIINTNNSEKGSREKSINKNMNYTGVTVDESIDEVSIHKLRVRRKMKDSGDICNSIRNDESYTNRNNYDNIFHTENNRYLKTDCSDYSDFISEKISSECRKNNYPSNKNTNKNKSNITNYSVDPENKSSVFNANSSDRDNYDKVLTTSNQARERLEKLKNKLSQNRTTEISNERQFKPKRKLRWCDTTPYLNIINQYFELKQLSLI